MVRNYLANVYNKLENKYFIFNQYIFEHNSKGLTKWFLKPQEIHELPNSKHLANIFGATPRDFSL